jgi:hypothetical protein
VAAAWRSFGARSKRRWSVQRAVSFFGHSKMHHQSSFIRIVSEPREAVGSTFVFGVIREAIHA